MKRPDRVTWLMSLALMISKRSTCSRRQVGALAEKDGRVLATGYNGAPSGFPHCIDRKGCRLDENGGCLDAVHAEANLIAFAAKHGISLEGATVYTTCAPCLDCAKLLINAGIEKVIYIEEYRDTRGKDLLIQAGVKVENTLIRKILGLSLNLR